MTEISSATPTPRTPCLHATIIGPFGIRDGEEKTCAAVEKAQAQHVSAKERPNPMKDAAREGYGAAACYQHFGPGGRVAVDARDRLFEAGDPGMAGVLGGAAQ